MPQKFELRRINWRAVGQLYALSYGITALLLIPCYLTGSLDEVKVSDAWWMLLFPAFYPTAMSVMNIVYDWLNPCPNHSDKVGTDCRTCGKLIEQRGIDLNKNVPG